MLIDPGKTAIKRFKASKPARLLMMEDVGLPAYSDFNNHWLLDYGCGRGVDLDYYATQGWHAVGYDPCEKFGHTIYPVEKYDIVVCNYVLNVIPFAERQDVLKKLQEHCRGYIFISVRSDVEECAKQGKWNTYLDGYLTNSFTFQKHFVPSELDNFLIEEELNPIKLKKYSTGFSITCKV
jgi:DNA phosphorothioation-associated putative methyltransferase